MKLALLLQLIMTLLRYFSRLSLVNTKKGRSSLRGTTLFQLPTIKEDLVTGNILIPNPLK